jgi:predicted membrane metal-binding protein
MEVEEEDMDNPENFPAPPPLVRQNAEINEHPNPENPNLGRFDAFDQAAMEIEEDDNDEVNQAPVRPPR